MKIPKTCWLLEGKWMSYLSYLMQVCTTVLVVALLQNFSTSLRSSMDLGAFQLVQTCDKGGSLPAFDC